MAWMSTIRDDVQPSYSSVSQPFNINVQSLVNVTNALASFFIKIYVFVYHRTFATYGREIGLPH